MKTNQYARNNMYHTVIFDSFNRYLNIMKTCIVKQYASHGNKTGKTLTEV